MASLCILAGTAKASTALAFSTALSGKRIESSSSPRITTAGDGGRQKGWRLARCDASHDAAEAQQFDTKEFRHTLTRGQNYNKTGFGYKKEMLQQMDVEYTSKFPPMAFRVSGQCGLQWRISCSFNAFALVVDV